ncbi:MAG TPA: AraC family transcriptional regulator [Ruminococcus flavefaciens]|nr:AraC family transcriptional regulator [Ruminococcus flavefaciens]HQL99150.1 AraC family transcriptional regulator [Ruminococcus flavefaciens]
MKDNINELGQPFVAVSCEKISEEPSLRLYGMLVCAKKEKVQIAFEDETVTAEAGEICYIRPMSYYSVTGGEALAVGLDLHTLEIPAAYINKVYSILGEKSSAVERYFMLNESEAQKAAEIAEKLCGVTEAYSYEGYLLAQQLVLALTEKRTSEKNSSYIDRISAYIDTHTAYQLEAVMLARMCGMSYPNFAKRFSERYGRSCKEHITHVRVSKAQRLLKNTALDISDIAAECGFFDSSHFIRTYKKKLGKTPNRDRK